MKLALVGGLLCAACCPSFLPAPNVAVVDVTSATVAEKTSFGAAFGKINAAAGRPVFMLAVPGSYHNVAVTHSSVGMEPPDLLGNTTFPSLGKPAVIRLSEGVPSDILDNVVLHECLHVLLGSTHNPDPNSVFSPQMTSATQSLTDADQVRIRDTATTWTCTAYETCQLID